MKQRNAQYITEHKYPLSITQSKYFETNGDMGSFSNIGVWLIATVCLHLSVTPSICVCMHACIMFEIINGKKYFLLAGTFLLLCMY